jgi:DNA-binding transcriptional LysR family regulator
MNIHHLELFYYVARHGGIAGAVRNMPYGIQQPAVSDQIARLEEALGTKLFNRRPFALLPAGTDLFEFIRPFFDEVDKVAARIRGASEQLSIAAPSIVLHDYLPQILQRVRRLFPAFRLQLHEAARPEAERLLRAREIDMAITVIDQKKPADLSSRPLLELPLVLLVTKKQRLTSAQQLWGRDKIEETLITFARGETVQAHFQEGLDQLGVEWFPGIEVNSTRLIECYVENGYGIGLTVATPDFKPSPDLRVLPLPNFPAVIVCAAWVGKLSPMAKTFLAELQVEATAVKRRARKRTARKA